MADQKRQTKRATRAERRAAEAAAERARAEQAAKERKQQTIIGLVVVAIIVVLVGIAGFAVWRTTHPSDTDSQASSMTVDEAYEALQEVSDKPANADDQGGFLISQNGYGTKVDGVPTLSIYMEPLCPGCASVNRQLDPTLIELMDAGQINLDLHFMTFQDSKSTDVYSTRAFNGAVYIAEHDDDPDHLLGYLANIYAEDFQPGELDDYTSVSDEQLKEQAIAAGVSSEVADAAFSGEYEYQEWLKASDAYTIRREELFSSSGSFSSPTLTINGTYWSLSDLSLADMTIVDGFLKSIGLDADQVGVSGELPSIGADGKPISVTTE
ncbi:disulfide bond formation protein DsbA [Bifidobacterium lemurum]|uniref:Disulfide bond formation protein DsbA n=1 Tax=Bifidobacterium lemurum TaxID=1603886 RepID=A0A261FKR3_9BIFI|nr:disulfide bond formation protein DsbA [Bifidobacterium lemurum]OZG59747.1 disulfide bond formation protein DsbA [Bifidobacterium lemurum]QOL35040.1 disulfide bond formation protein DsbA [Bifidobacterium lemurum]